MVARQQDAAVVPSHAGEHVELGEDALLQDFRGWIARQEHEEAAQPRRVLGRRHAARAEG